MRVNIPLTVTITTGVACFFSLLVLSLAASFNIKRRNYNSTLHPSFARVSSSCSTHRTGSVVDA